MALGVNTGGESPIDQFAPYWRVAIEPSFGNHNLEIGTFGLKADLVPQRITGAGTDSITDLGVDAQYQYIQDKHTVTLRASWIHQDQNLSASQPLGFTDNSHDNLRSFRTSISYIYDNTWSISGGYFSLRGTTDATLYGTATGSPNSRGWIAELAYLPFSHGGPAFWPWANARIGLQYALYDKFDGAGTNYDGNGRNAHNNNTIFLYTWIAF